MCVFNPEMQTASPGRGVAVQQRRSDLAGMRRLLRTTPSLVLTVLLLAVAPGMFLGCAQQKVQSPPELRMPDSFSGAGSEELPDEWWTAFGDERLSTLVDRALQKNFDLETAWQRLRQARAAAERESAPLFPDLTANAEGEIVRSDTAGDSETLRLGFTSSYEVDLWGRISSRAEAERYRARADLADYRAAAVSLSAEVARAWYQLAEVRSRMELLERQIGTNKKALNALRSRFRNGRTRRVDVLRQQRLLESTREQKLAAQSRARVLAHQLAVLTGRPPQEGVRHFPEGLPDPPPLPETGLPADLVRRRPDVKRAHFRIRAADRELAAAVSRQYPRLTLTASLTTDNRGVNTLFQDWARSFAADLAAPLIDAGERSAEADRYRALRKQRLYEYGQAVLTAFQEVEDALVREKKQLQRIRSLKKQVRSMERAVERLRLEYASGSGDFLDFLDARTQKQQLRRELLQARLQRVEYRIALYRALAGGFETARESGDEAGVAE